jgi:hypothetical protein
VLEWHPTILHDLHESEPYLYISTGTGPYNVSLDPISIDEWWLLGETEIMELAKRGVPGVLDLRLLRRLGAELPFWIALTHNSFGRFYEVQSYGPDLQPNLQLPVTSTSREWFRPNPPLPSVKWGPRNNTNIQESAILIALNQVGRIGSCIWKITMKNQRSVDKGKNGPTVSRWVIPAGQRRKADAAHMVNDLAPPGRGSEHRRFRVQGRQAWTWPRAITSFAPTSRTARWPICISACRIIPAESRPYDDTGWTMQYMRDVKLTPVIDDKSVLDHPMTLLTADAKAPAAWKEAATRWWSTTPATTR